MSVSKQAKPIDRSGEHSHEGGTESRRKGPSHERRMLRLTC